MSETETPKPNPKGGRKGGTQFPQIDLKDAAGYAKKLVSKTHTGPQPDSVILPGVFGSNHNIGKIRASALKQYGLLVGEAAAYEASDLAKNIDAAPDNEKQPLLQRAFLNAKVFKSLYDTFVGDGVSPAKIRQQVAQLGVHPDNSENATKLFMDSAIFAGTGRVDGETFLVIRTDAPSIRTADDQISKEFPESEQVPTETDNENADKPENSEDNDAAKDRREGGARAVINVSVTLDSSLDTDKLEKQLKLLRKYGAI